MSVLHVEQYEIFNSTFGIFERTAYDVWFSWYRADEPTVMLTLMVGCFIFAAIVVGLVKVISAALAGSKLMKNDYLSALLFGLAAYKGGIFFVPIYAFFYLVGVFGFTIYYMMGYTL